MSRTYLALAGALAGVAALVGVAAALESGGGTASPAAATTTVPAVTQPADTQPAATAAPSTEVAISAVPSTTEAPTTTLPRGEGCQDEGTSAVVDRDRQRGWLCEDGYVTYEFPITTAWTLPDPGDYPIYAKDMNATSNFGGHFSRMTHFVAFTYGKNTGARVAFHSVPTFTDGQFVQPLASVGDLSRRGESSGCIRVLPDDAVLIWDTLAIGDHVVVLN